jgi:hypothetical protein
MTTLDLVLEKEKYNQGEKVKGTILSVLLIAYSAAFTKQLLSENVAFTCTAILSTSVIM